MRILFTNQAFHEPAGTELYVRDVAFELQRRGHDPGVYSPRIGGLAEELRSRGIPVWESTGAIEQAPDVIHGHHHLELLTALLRFPDTPAVGFCHGLKPWQETPLKHPRVLQHVVVSELTAERVRRETGVPAERVHRIPNFVDMRRFVPRAPLPEAPARALVFDNYLHEGNGLRAVQRACRNAGLRVDALGRMQGTMTPTPELLLPQYDVVFAAGRSALEALATGTAVIVCSAPGLGGMVTPENVDRFRRKNFGLELLSPAGPAEIERELNLYDRDAAAAVSGTIRATASLEDAVDALLQVYESTIAMHVQEADGPAKEIQAIAEYFETWGPKYEYGKAATTARSRTGAAGRSASSD